MKKIVSLLLAVSVAAIIVGCSTTAQRTEYNTISTIEQSSTAAYNSYCALVIRGVVPTNSLPQVSKVYNDIQASATLAAAVAEAGTNAIASAELQSEFSDLSNLISTVTASTK